VSATAALAAPYRPTDDREILEPVTESASDPRTRRLQALQQELAQNPMDLDLALRVAQAYVERGRAQSDPRYYGYAQAALAPWWPLAEPPTAVLVLRATIRQHNHEFEKALADLSRAVEAEPRNASAWWTRALVLQAQGESSAAKVWAEADRDLTDLSPLVPTITPRNVDLVSKRVGNYQRHPLFGVLLDQLQVR